MSFSRNPQAHRGWSVLRYVFCVGILLALAAFWWRGTPPPKLVETGVPAAESASAGAKTTRRVYPFSVIYGGAYSGEELARARAVDAVVARHYQGFGLSPAVLRMPQDTFMYVSYRKGNQVFWTKTKHRIPNGETVLSDGHNLARTRCGNRLSPKPQAPIAPGEEPDGAALDFPDKPKAPLASTKPMPSAPDADFFVPGNPGDVPSALRSSSPNAPPMLRSAVTGADSEKPYAFGSSPGGAGPFLGPGMFYPTASGVSSSGSSGGANSSGIGALAVSGTGAVAPEPSTLPLLCLGVLLGGPAVVRGWRKRNQQRPK